MTFDLIFVRSLSFCIAKRPAGHEKMLSKASYEWIYIYVVYR